MSKKKPVVVEGNDHVVEYTETSGEKITATFPTAEHCAVLKNRLTAHGIPFVYTAPETADDAVQE